jgi:hypothetical protein
MQKSKYSSARAASLLTRAEAHLGHAENAEKLRTNSVSVEAQSGLNPLFLSW